MDHQRLVLWIVAPSMLTELITAIALLWLQPFGVGLFSIWLGMFLLITIWLATYFIQVPQHASLALCYDSAIQRQLVTRNWFRTAAWSARGLLVLWMVSQVISSVANNSAAALLVQTYLP